MLKNVIAIMVLGILLTGCVGANNLATLSEGACKAFPRPEYQIKGKTVYDQKWADKTTEAGVAGCNWKRPEPRPESLDAPIDPPPFSKPIMKPKKPTFTERWWGKIWK